MVYVYSWQNMELWIILHIIFKNMYSVTFLFRNIYRTHAIVQKHAQYTPTFWTKAGCCNFIDLTWLFIRIKYECQEYLELLQANRQKGNFFQKLTWLMRRLYVSFLHILSAFLWLKWLQVNAIKDVMFYFPKVVLKMFSKSSKFVDT